MTPLDAGSILVVDDDRVNRTLLTRALTASGHSVTTAENGRQALCALEETIVDLVLLDIEMPELDGIATLERIKGDPGLEELPVIMISAVDDYDSVVRCIELGAEDYLQKPFDPVLLRARIGAGLTKRRLQELERSRVRETFARYLPEPIVEKMLERTNAGAQLGGVRVIGTALFADVRAFTTFAEVRPPDRVIDVLNRYFSEMSEAVLDAGGTLVSYLGDGMFAIFGAPVEYPDHADRALSAAHEMVNRRLPRFNDWLRQSGADDFRIGIGLSSGPIMSGNIGSERRLDYTAIGDTVNTASRLEEHTKTSGHAVLLSDETRELLSGDHPLAFVAEIKLRGRSAATRVWALDAP